MLLFFSGGVHVGVGVGCLCMRVCVCVCGMLICFVSALGSHETGRHKIPVIFSVSQPDASSAWRDAAQRGPNRMADVCVSVCSIPNCLPRGTF